MFAISCGFSLKLDCGSTNQGFGADISVQDLFLTFSGINITTIQTIMTIISSYRRK
jgi:hypothetical protein